MAAPVAPDVLGRQVDRLAADLHELSGQVADEASAIVRDPAWAASSAVGRLDVYLTGSGDSHHAARAAEMAFETYGGVACEAVSAQRFADYAGPALPLRAGRSVVLVGSASGNSPQALAAARAAREHGGWTVAIVGRRDSPLASETDQVLVIEPPELERSPGIRTYQATLLGLFALALALADRRGTRPAGEPAAGVRLAGLADDVERTARMIKGLCERVAEEIASAPTLLLLGGGPALGTAMFAAAKLVEAAGLAAQAQDLDEWWHVERRALPADMPVFVIAPPGRSHRRAGHVVAAARRLGRRVIVVAQEHDAALARHAHAVLPVPASVPEEFSPLLYHVFAGYTAAVAAQLRGRMAFQDDPGDLPSTLEECGDAAGLG